MDGHFRSKTLSPAYKARGLDRSQRDGIRTPRDLQTEQRSTRSFHFGMENSRCADETELKQRRGASNSDTGISEYSRSTFIEDKNAKGLGINKGKGKEVLSGIGSMSSINLKAKLSQLKQSAHERAAGVMTRVE